MPLVLTSFEKALSSLERSLSIAEKLRSGELSDPLLTEVIKSGIIQNFEFTYELCWKFIKRWLDQNYSESHTAGLTRKQLFRLAAENLLIEDCERWLVYHELRNKTSHTYDASTAEEIFSASAVFYRDARALFQAIEARND